MSAFISFVGRRFNKALCRTVSVCSLPGGWWVPDTPFQSQLYWPSPEFQPVPCLHQSPAASRSLQLQLCWRKSSLASRHCNEIATQLSLATSQIPVADSRFQPVGWSKPCSRVGCGCTPSQADLCRGAPGWHWLPAVGNVHARGRALQSAHPAGSTHVGSWSSPSES